MPNKATSTNTSAQTKRERAIAAVLDELTPSELSRLAVDVIKENRRRLSLAQSLFERLDASMLGDAGVRDLCHDYRLALLELKIHHDLVRIIVEELDYVPQVPET